MPHLHNRSGQMARRKALRNAATPAEQYLWKRLKGSRLHGRKFRRQHGIGPYILDFYCPAERLAVELDGAPHNDPARAGYDAERQHFLDDLGIRVLRFENRLVLEQPDLVLAAIAEAFRDDTNSPPPQARRGPGGG